MLTKLIKRNVKLFFKDKGMFLTSLITPLILLVLYVAFLGNAYRTTFKINFTQARRRRPATPLTKIPQLDSSEILHGTNIDVVAVFASGVGMHKG